MPVNYSLDQDYYKGTHKSCFTVPLNIAWDNGSKKGCENLLKEAMRTRGGFTQEDIEKVHRSLAEKLNGIRDYFSHYYHEDKPLEFKKGDDDAVKDFLEKTFSYAAGETQKRVKESGYQGIIPPIFELCGDQVRITAAGVIFLASFFVPRSTLERMFGAVQGFKRSDRGDLDTGQKRDYYFTRSLLSFYTLRDSYYLQADETRPFREILSYLSCVPFDSVQWLQAHGKLSKSEEKEFFGRPVEEQDEENPAQTEKQTAPAGRRMRKKNKFILFAVRFIEAWARNEKLSVEFGRYRNIQNEEDRRKQSGKKVREVFFPSALNNLSAEEQDLEGLLYIRNNHALIRIHLKAKTPVTVRISEHELMYLVLAILSGKGGNAVQKLSKYVWDVRMRSRGPLTNMPRNFPAFLRSPASEVSEQAVQNRLNYIRKTLKEIQANLQKEAQTGQWILDKGQKIRHILRFISDSMPDFRRRPSVKEYNELRELLQTLAFDDFYRKLASFQTERKLDAAVWNNLAQCKSINELCERCCQLQQQRLDELEKQGGDELKRYIGLLPKEKGKHYEEQNTPARKFERFIENQLSVPKYFLRCKLFVTGGSRRTNLLKLVQEHLKPKTSVFHEERLYLREEQPGDYPWSDRKIIQKMYYLYVQDLLCMQMAQWHYEHLTPQVKGKIDWEINSESKESDGYNRFKVEYKGPQGCRIIFRVQDFGRLDFLNKAPMLDNICQWFLSGRKEITWPEFLRDGLQRYRQRQILVVRALFRFEENLKIPEEEWKGKSHLSFDEVLERFSGKNRLSEEEKESIRRVRNDFFHEEFEATPSQWRDFERRMSEYLNKEKREKPKKKKR
ncbi:MAG TPA: hypothetical protein PLP49_11115 [Anaerohalosphaeraceae bacterium]|nr:hypothetical protein [Anaerohalosphaeraceae bacterium]HPB93997.1 hypothetical protein [Anaerohalosphaeraceae bacterium]HRT24821.1 hypothetical protein [Anaerohalosphaeraceae bacterium]